MAFSPEADDPQVELSSSQVKAGAGYEVNLAHPFPWVKVSVHDPHF